MAFSISAENLTGDALTAALHAQVVQLDRPAPYAPLLDLIGGSRFALIGEASHGTYEFYQERAEITKQLILEKNFDAIVVEADWPDAYRVNRYVRGNSADRNADIALSDFKRFPSWMWRNQVMLDFVNWLREHNDGQPPQRKVGFYGMDLYSLFTSINAVLSYLEQVDPAAAARARYRYACFDHFGESMQAYSYAAAFDLDKSCEDAVVAQLVELTKRAADYDRYTGRDDPDALFHAEQNAILVKDAEEYYRTMLHSRVSSWNLRDRHMVQTLRALDVHLAGTHSLPRIAVWAHNSHLGDASATEMGMEHGEWNVGQLMRDHYGNAAALIGFSTYKGTVTAASEWDGPAECMQVRAGLAGSCEALFHSIGHSRFLLRLRGNRELSALLASPRLQRAIGVIYRPETERRSHYFHMQLAKQFDAMIHIDETTAVAPLEPGAEWTMREAPETYPSGF